MRHATGFVAVLLAGFLAGSEATSRFIVHPALWRLPHAAQVKAEKQMYRRFGMVDPFLMTATIVAGYSRPPTPPIGRPRNCWPGPFVSLSCSASR